MRGLFLISKGFEGAVSLYLEEFGLGQGLVLIYACKVH